MNESWRPIRDFPGYSVSDRGDVRNDETGRIMTQLQNRQGVVHVGLTRDGRQYRRAVALLVAKAFLPPPSPTPFDTPINLDGDRTNNAIENLMWRPRWFAILYHKQFKQPRRGINAPIEDIKTKDYYPNSWTAATTLGLLDKDIRLAIYNRTYVWPTYQVFRVIGEFTDIGR